MIRKLEADDTSGVAEVWLRSGLEEYGYLPEFQKLTLQDARRIFIDVIVENCSIWVYESDEVIQGFVALKADHVDRLYVDPVHQRRGVGTALLEHAKELHPEGLVLFTHQQNLRARHFYEKHGFVPVRFGVSPAPESVPDVEYRWPDTVSQGEAILDHHVG